MCVAHAERPAVRPVDFELWPYWPSEQRTDWHTVELADDVQDSVLNGRDALSSNAPDDMACYRSKVGQNLLERQWVLPCYQLAHPLNHLRDTDVALFQVFGPSDDRLAVRAGAVGADFHEAEVAEPRTAPQRLHRGDDHGTKNYCVDLLCVFFA